LSPALDERSRRELEWKIWIFAIAAVVGLTGVFFDEKWMTGSSIGLLAVAMLVRFLPHAQPSVDADDEDSA